MSDRSIRVRLLPKTPEPDVINEIYELDYKCFPVDDPPNMAARWWLAYVGGKTPVAFAGMEIVRVDGRLVGYLTRCGVHPDYRGLGIQRRMLTARTSYASRAGCHRAVTYTLANNCPSINSLISRGFSSYHPKNRYAGDDVCYWQRHLF